MIDTYSVPLSDLVKEFDLQVEFASTDFDSIRLTVEDVSRPGIQLAGYFDHFDPMRLQVLGNVEMSYLSRLSEQARASILDRLFSYKFPALLITRGIRPSVQCLEMAKKHNVTLLRTTDPTSTMVSAIITYLKAALAPRITRHGVLMEIYGEGVLLTGESGIGKSEAALELIKRGHRLVSDDVVEIKKVSDETLIGTAPDITRHFIELRGIGIIDVKTLFGVESVKNTQSIDLVIKLEEWNRDKEYDRFGLEEEYTEFLGNKVVCHSIPIRPGRNLAIICESAAVNKPHLTEVPPISIPKTNFFITYLLSLVILFH